jgi:hypothetical protein
LGGGRFTLDGSSVTVHGDRRDRGARQSVNLPEGLEFRTRSAGVSACATAGGLFYGASTCWWSAVATRRWRATF